jgi:phthalate 4,5-cis-dihydrodiol dehydrogenase
VSILALQLGVIGLGRAFTLMLPTWSNDPRIKLVGATDPLVQARVQFESDFGVPTFASVEALCAQTSVQAVYIASPHQFHAEHVEIAARAGKHVLVEKPMALTLDECTRMIEVTERAGVRLIVGHSHSFNAQIQCTRQLIDSGDYGSVKMIHALNFTDFLYRPRRPEELNTELGGGVIHSQASHQIDIIRMLGGGLVQSVRAFTSAWDAERPTEGAYSALLGFSEGCFASATYSGYAHFDSDELMGHIGEMGQAKDPNDYGASRKRLANAVIPGATSTTTTTSLEAQAEAELKAARNYGGRLYSGSKALPLGLAHQHFGQLIVSCEKADLRPGPLGVTVYANDQQIHLPLAPPRIPRVEVVDELYNVVMLGQPALHNGQWARATTAVCLAMLASAQQYKEITPDHQVAYAQDVPSRHSHE